jgi:hypothetical protein
LRGGFPRGGRGFGTQGTVLSVAGDTITNESQRADGTITRSTVTTAADTTVTELLTVARGDLAGRSLPATPGRLAVQLSTSYRGHAGHYDRVR